METEIQKCLCGRAQEASLTCGLCEGPFCKKCIEFVSQETFSFLSEVPKDLCHNQYCLSCYADKVRTALRNYNETMKRAKQIMIIDKPRRRPLTILKRLEGSLSVENCSDREDAILRLAFKAAELGYNSVIKVNVIYKKVGREGYTKLAWQGKGYAAEIVDRKVD